MWFLLPKKRNNPKHKKRLIVLYKVKLKNSLEEVLMDVNVHEFLINEPYFKKVKFLENLRRHSSGCAVFQKTTKKPEGGYATETIYLHKFIAETYLLDQKQGEKELVGAKNGNKLDCRLENLCWRSRAVASRKRKTSSKTGYTGVYQENNRFRAVISVNRKSIHIGMFDSAEKAALAYNEKSIELFGKDGKVNEIRTAVRPEHQGLSSSESRHNSNGSSTNGSQSTNSNLESNGNITASDIKKNDLSSTSDFTRASGF